MGLNPKLPIRKKEKTIDPFSVEGIHQAATSSTIGKLIEEGKKYSPNQQLGDVTMQGVDDDEIASLFGSGSGTLDASQIQTASSYTSKRDQAQINQANYEAKAARERAKKLAAVEAHPHLKELKDNIVKETGSEKAAEEKLLKFADTQTELDHLKDKTLWGRVKTLAEAAAYTVLKTTQLEDPNKYVVYAALGKGLFAGLTPAEEKKYGELQNYKRKEIEPALAPIEARGRLMHEQALAKAEELKQAKLKDDASPMFLPDGSVGPKANSTEDRYTPYAEESYWRTVASKHQDLNELISDYRTGNNDFFAGISTTSQDVGTLGLRPVVNDFRAKEVFDKINRIHLAEKKGLKSEEKLSEGENALAEAYHLEGQLQQLKLHDNDFAYNLGAGVGSSAGFMAQMILTRGAGAIAKQGVTSLIKGGLKSGIRAGLEKGFEEEVKLGLRGLLKQSIKKGTLSSLKEGGKEALKRGTAAGVGLAVQAPISPMFYKAYASDQVGGIEKVVTKDGKEKYVVKDELYEMKSPYYKDQLKSLDRLIELEKDENKKGELESKRNSLQAEWDSFIPKSELSSLMYAAGEYGKEAFSEAYVGKGLGLVGKGLRKGLNYVPKAGAVVDAAGDILTNFNSPFKKLTNAVNNLTLGRASFEKIGKDSGGSLIGGIPEEAFEEVFVQAMPALNQTTAQYKENFKELGKLSFYRDVIAQTAVMGIGFQSLGAAGRLRAYSKDKTNYSQLLKDLEGIDVSQDEKKALELASGNKLASPVDYRIVSNKLREVGKNDAADQLEQRMFINMAQQAARLGKMGSYKESVNNLINRKDIPETFKQNALQVTNQVEAIHKVHQEHSDKENFAEILNATVYVGLHEDNVKKLKQQLPTLEDHARGEVEAYKKRTGKIFDFTPETVLTKEFENEEDKKSYLATLNELINPDKEGNIAVQNLVTQVKLIRTTELDIAENKKIINDELSPKRQEKLKAKKALRDEYDLIEEDLQAGKITLPEIGDTKEDQPEGLNAVVKAKAIIKHIEESYGNMISPEDLQELKDDKIERAKTERNAAIQDLSISKTEKIENQNSVPKPDTDVDMDLTPVATDTDKYEDDTELPTDAINSNPALDAAFGLAHQGLTADPEPVVGVPDVVSQPIDLSVPVSGPTRSVDVQKEIDYQVNSQQENLEDTREELKKEQAVSFFKRDKNLIKYLKGNIEFYEKKLKQLKEDPISYYKDFLQSSREEHQERLKDPKEVKELTDRYGSTDFEVTHSDFIGRMQGIISELDPNKKPVVQSNVQTGAPIVIPADNTFFEGEPMLGKIYPPEFLKHIEDTLEGMTQIYEDGTGNRITFSEIFEHYKSKGMLEDVKKNFGAMSSSWLSLNKKFGDNMFPIEDFTATFRAMYPPVAAFDVFATMDFQDGNIVTPQVPVVPTMPINHPAVEVRQENEKIQTAALISSRIVGQDESNREISQQVVETIIDTQRTSNIEPKMGYSSLEYTEQTEDGVYRKVSIPILNTNKSNGVNITPILDPDGLQTGDTVGIEVAKESEWKDITVSNGRTPDGKVILTTFDRWLAEKPRTQEEIDAKIPMYFTSAGQRISAVHDADWYNGYNVADPSELNINPHRPVGEWANDIQKGKQSTQNLRQAVLKGGLKEVTIRRSPTSVFQTVEDGELVPLLGNNPQSVLAVQVGEKISVGNKQPFKDGVILNEADFSERKNGKLVNDSQTWEIRREGKMQRPDGTFVNTYRAFKVQRKVTEEQLETVKWALAANAVKNKFNSYLTAPTPWTSMTEVQAQNIREQVLNHTGLDIFDAADLVSFVESFLQLSDKPSSNQIAYYQKNLLKENLDMDAELLDAAARQNNKVGFVQHTKESLLKKEDFKSAVHIINGQVQPLNMTYHTYLKSTLMTNVLSFNIGTEAKPNYITAVQPIINIQYSPVEGIASQTEAEKVVEIANTVTSTGNIPAFNVSEQYEFAATLGIDIDSYQELEEGEAMIANDTSSLQSLLTSIAGLTTPQEQDIRQYVTQSIAQNKQYIDEEGKTLNKKRSVIEQETKSQLLSTLENTKNAIKTNLEIVSAQSEDTANKRAFVRAYTDTLANLDAIEKEYKELFKRAAVDFEKQSKTELDDQDEVEDALNEKNYNKDSVEENSKLSVGTILRNFMHGVQKKDSRGVGQTGYLGLPKYYTFNEIFNELTKVLSLGSDLPSSYDALVARLEASEVPFTKDILVKLKDADTQTKNQFLYTFVKHSMSSNFTMYQESGEISELKSYETNANEATRVIEKKWKNNNRTSSLYNRNLTINSTVAGELIDTYEKWLNEEDNTPENHRTWLTKLGIGFTDAAWDKIVSEGIKDKYSYNNLLFDKSQGIFLPIVNFLREAKANPANYLHNEDKNIFKELSGMFKSLAKIEAIYNPNLVSLTYRDGDKTIFTQTPETFMSDKVNDLLDSLGQEDNSLIDDLQNLSFSENSLILSFLQKEGGNFKELFKVSHAAIVTLKERGEESSERSSITDLGEIDYDLNVNGQFGDRKIKQLTTSEKISGIHARVMRMLTPTMSDKSKAYYLDTIGLDLLRGEELLENEQGEVTMSDRLLGVLIEQLIMPEVKRIINYHAKVKQTNIKDYDKGATIFHLIPALNTLKNKEGLSILEELAIIPNLTADIVKTDYLEQFKDVVANVIFAEARAKKELWKEHYVEGVGSKMFAASYFTEVKKNPAKDYNKAVYDVVINGMLHNSEMFKVFAGDMALYSKNGLYKIEDPSDSTKIKTQEDYTIEDWLAINKAVGVNLGKRLAALAAPGNKIAGSADPKFRKYNQIFLEDSADIAPNSEYLIGLHYGKNALTPAIKTLLEDYSANASIVHQYEIGKTLDVPAVDKAKKDMAQTRNKLKSAFPVIADYFEIESTDAQEYTTVREHINVLNRQGRLSDAKMKMIEAKLNANQPLAREDMKVIMQPIKPVHTGSYADKTLDVNRYVYIKSSSYPLLPEFTKGTKLDALRVKMEELEKTTGRFTRASFQSANKVGAARTTVNPFDKYSLEGIKEYAEGDVNAKVLVLDRNNFRIQQDVPVKSEKTKADKISMGTQFFKLLFGDGITNLDGFQIPGEKKMTGKELHKYYSDAFAELAKYKRTELFQELGLNSKGEIENKKDFIYSLGKLLEKEAVSRGYSLKSIAGLKIDELAMAAGVFYEFKTPLWLSSDKNRYESLLNSIVTNRLMQHKISGNAYVAGSESGIQMKEGLNSITDFDERSKSRIIYLNNFNGKELGATSMTEEDGTPVFKKAQVFVRSYFKNPSTGELVNLFEGYNNETGDVSKAKYLIRRTNGTLGLKEGMIDENLMNMFSFRTPTSSHVSGSSIEIAGILPPEMGELMIVPKNFTKQKGLDFDVDKENTYQLNHYIDAEGNIKEVNSDYITDIQNSLKELKFYKERDYETIAEVEEQLSDLQDRLSVATNVPYTSELQSEVEGLWAMLKDSKTSIKDINHTMKGIQKNLETKVASQIAENKFIKSHLAVFNNPNVEVQNKINKVLSMSFAQDQAKMFEKAVEDGNKAKEVAKYVDLGLTLQDAEQEYLKNQSYNTVLSYSYQKMKMDLGSIGKTAIGVYANYTTMAGLIQQQEAEITLDTDITLGNITSKGQLGVLNSLRPSNISEGTWKGLSRTVAEIFAEKENTATDNEKEQILGRVGVNDQTINVDSLLTMLGFDTDLVSVPGMKEKQKMALPYLLLSQPSIKNYNKKIQNSKGVLAKGFFDVNKLKKDTIEELTNGDITFGKDPSLSAIDPKNISTFRYALTGEVYKAGKKLTGQAMYDGIASQGASNPLVQAEALISFLELDKHAKNVSKAQKVLNTNELGKSLVESSVSYRALANLPNSPIKNISKLLGEFEKAPETITEDMYKIGDFYVTPTTPQGHITIHGLQAGNTLFKSFFPYSDVGINSVINQVLLAQGIDPNVVADSTYIKEFHKIMEEMIKYINSNPNNNTYIGDTKAKRQDLFVDSDTNTSISTYLRDLATSTTNKRGVNAVLKNALYSRFSYTTGAEGELSLIKYNNTSTDNLDEEILYNAIPELILSNLPLPDRNGKPYSTRQLGEDLVAYSFLEGGVQEATQFSKFIPVQLMEVMGQMETRGENEIFVPINRKLQMFNNRENSPTFFDNALGIKVDDIASFTRQYFQNNPKKVKKAWSKNVKFTEQGQLSYETNQGVSPKFITYSSAVDGVRKESLYENVGGNVYRKIDIVGQLGIKEYTYKQPVLTSIFNTEETIEDKPAVIEETKILEAITMDGLSTPESLLEQIQNLNFSAEQKFLAETAKWLTPLLKEGLVTIKISESLPGGIAGHTSRPNSKGEILIALSKDKLSKMSKEKGSELIIHEVLHSVAVSHLTEYFDNSGKALRSDVFIPAHVTSLFQAYNTARKVYEAEVKALEDKIAHNKVLGNPKLEFTDRELNVIYGLTNVFEFVSVAMTSEDFHNEFKSVPYLQSGKSILSKIEDFFINMLDSIYPGLKEDSVAKASVLASMKFLQEERVKTVTKTTKQVSIPNASVAMTYGKNLEVPLNERISQKLPTTLELDEGISVDTKTLLELSQLKKAAMFGPFFDWNKYDDTSKEELTEEDVREEFKKEYGPTAFDFVEYIWGEDVSIAELEFLRDNPIEGLKIVEAWSALADEELNINDNILSYFADRFIKKVPLEYIDKNQMSLFEDTTNTQAEALVRQMVKPNGKMLTQFTVEEQNLINTVPLSRKIEIQQEEENNFESKGEAMISNPSVKPGVEELFDSNPELANEVYEALGIKNKPDVIIPIGTSGSGKSTFIKSLPQDNLVVIEPDAMRVEFTGDINNKSKDKEVYEEAAKRAVKAIKQGKQVVFDTTNLTKDKRLPFIEAIKKALPNANIQYKLMELNPELAKQRIRAQIERGENRANVSDATIDRHAESYKQMLEDIKSEPIGNFEITPQQKQQALQQYSKYLDSIFPDSQVKDIVYHTVEGFKEFVKTNNLTTFDSSIETMGITKEEWDGLTAEEQDRIKKCN